MKRLFWSILAVLISASGQVFAQSSPCDPLLPQPASTPYGYRLRGDRCEGLYIQQVGGAPLTVASWTQTFEEYDLAARGSLKVEWDSGHGSAPVRLRAQGLRRRLYYRMDAVRPAGSKSFTWSTDVLSALSIPRHDAGIVGLTETAVGGASQDVYLPLRVTQQRSAKVSSHGDAYLLTLVPGVEMKELFLTLTGPAGPKPATLKNGEAVGYGFYPAERPVEVPLTGMHERGFYHLSVGSTMRSGGVAAVELWFYHPGS